jgi:prepilin-type N-terminal cleavage/methylation domain-containing protein
MYPYTTPIPGTRQLKTNKDSGFTLVEIMIVILIILLMTQIGNLWSLFRQKEKSQLEEIAVQILGRVDEEKTNALLGKTYKKTASWKDSWAIVRKRSMSLGIDNDAWDISFISKVNLAESKETWPDIFEPESITKTWHLQGLKGSWYECRGNLGENIQNAWRNVDTTYINFIQDAIFFGVGEIENLISIDAPHIVLKLSINNAHQEIHIDKRTWLTYARVGFTDGVLCN